MAWGYINKSGGIVIAINYLMAYEFIDHKACVKNEKGCTYIHTNGIPLFDKHFDEPSDFFNERARLSEKELYGYINMEGEWVIKPVYHAAGHFQEGLARVRKGVKSYFIDGKGEIKIDPDCAKVNDFRCGLANITFRGRTYYIDQRGEKVSGPFDAGEDFSDDVVYVLNNGESFFIDKKGNILFKLKSRNVSHYCNNNRISFGEGEKYGFLDKTGRIAIKPRFDDVKDFRNGFAVFSNGKKKGFIDIEGNILFERKLKILEDLYENLAVFSEDEDLYGFCDRNGNIVVQPQWSYAKNFSCGLAAVSNKPL